MDFDRRSFVKFAVGAAMGFAAGPVGIKLTDDVAIWTQNWSWVPRPEKGALAFANTVNPATGDALRTRIIKGRTKGQRIIRAEGNPKHPLCGGGMVPDDASAVQLLYNDEMRVNTPLRHDRYSDRWASITWPQALAELAGAIGKLKGSPGAIAALGADPHSSDGQLLRLFMAALGSSNLAFRPGPAQTLALAGQQMFGQSELGFDLAGAELVLSFGAPLMEGFGAPAATVRALAGGAKLVQVEARASRTASMAEIFVGCGPGQLGKVALALAAHLLTAGKHDKAAEGAPGFAQFKALAAKYAPQKAAAAAGADAKAITKAAERFAAAGKAVALIGGGEAGDPGSLADYAAVMALNVLKGNLGKPGGLVFRPADGLKDLGAMPQPGFDPVGLAKSGAGQVKLAICAGGNPAFAPGMPEVTKFLNKTPLVVAITPYLDETAAAADLVLPQAHFLESWGDSTTPYGSPVNSYGIHRPLVRPRQDAMSLGDILIALAKKLGGKPAAALKFAGMEAALKARAAGLGDFSKLAEKSFAVEAKASSAKPAKVSFLALEPKPVRPAAAYPLVMTAINSARTRGDGQPISPYMLKILDDTTLADSSRLVVEINPATAAKLGVAEGDAVKITSPAGSIAAKVHLFAGAAPGAVFVPVGLGHSGFGFYLRGKGANFAALAAISNDPLSKLPRWGVTPVAVSKA